MNAILFSRVCERDRGTRESSLPDYGRHIPLHIRMTRCFIKLTRPRTQLHHDCSINDPALLNAFPQAIPDGHPEQSR